jgi:hypothetical protein
MSSNFRTVDINHATARGRNGNFKPNQIEIYTTYLTDPITTPAVGLEVHIRRSGRTAPLKLRVTPEQAIALAVELIRVATAAQEEQPTQEQQPCASTGSALSTSPNIKTFA